jgi:hypothetical protein
VGQEQQYHERPVMERSGFLYRLIRYGYGGNIYDACAGPHTGTRTEAQYVSDTVDTSTPVEANPPWCAPKAAGDTANIIGGSLSDLQ